MQETFDPAVGRSVVYGFPNPAFEEGLPFPRFIYRPAQIVRVWSATGLKTVNLVVFIDGSNDRGYGFVPSTHLTPDQTPLLWKTSVPIGQFDDKGFVIGMGQHYLPRVPEYQPLS